MKSEIRLFTRNSVVRKFDEGTQWVKPFTDSDSEMVVEVVRWAVLADIKLISNGLAVDFVEQRVQLTRNGVGGVQSKETPVGEFIL